MDLNNVKDAIGQLLNQSKLNLPISDAEEKQVKGIVDKVKKKQSLSDEDRKKAVKLVSQFSKQLAPQQGQQLKAMLDQLMKAHKVSDKDKAALEQIKKML
ncbi:hypothetical protein F9B85_07745 [Heliorestis acidaminivorans]|uniref:Stage VI sporulation protein F n=1 Tax=Heliorestis acidaminivorans TaxID=553427 RepID=A0A6I0ETQ9_9FIRM|nr:hypothetical protein [Heliorestis acidaminivorans]KAB2952550.1 hypothetical protein F9B85_07745 [Heliorestis acidaminivorans]